jgi:hypothetical protein
MPFSLIDFQNNEIRMRLQIILNDKHNKLILTKFSDLSKKEKEQYNTTLNEYIYNLPEIGYLEKIITDFNEIVSEYYDNKNFKFENASIQNLNSFSLELSKEDNLDVKLLELEREHLQPSVSSIQPSVSSIQPSVSSIRLDERC